MNLEFKWYVLRVISGKEKKSQESIQLLLDHKKKELKQYIKNIVLPIERYYYLKSKKKILKERIFYPGYVMIEVVLNEEVKNFFQKINYVVGFLGKPNSIIPLTDKEITRFFNKVNIISDKSISLNKYYMGESIKIIDGPFNGFNGVIEDINEEKKRLKIIVKIFGRRTPVELNYFQVER